MTLIVSLLLGLVLAFRSCEGSFSILSEPREACAGYQGIADAIAALTTDVEGQTGSPGSLASLEAILTEILNSLKVYPSCAFVTGGTGLYRIQEGNTAGPMPYFCQTNFLGGTWTMMQRRTSGRTNFSRSFAEYRDGFGHPSSEFWLGLTRINLMTATVQYELVIVLEAFDGAMAVVRYTNFKIADASNNFKLTALSGYSGGGPDSMASSLGMTFSTFDKDTDTSSTVNCASTWGGGWWFSNCGDSNLNGFYRGATPTTVAKTSMVWTGFKGEFQSLKGSTMFIRRYVPILMR